jgi:type IV pilus assembly protein PilP
MMRPLFLTVVSVLLFSGCGPKNEELRQWMAEQRKEVKPVVEPIYPPTKFEPQPYIAITGMDPFSLQKLTLASQQDSRQSNAMLASETRRRKEPLEAFPLDSMTMVGSVTREGRPHALIRINNLLHYVKVGDYLGQDYGKITHIGESQVDLREIVQDATGDWVERTSSLQLQEKAK